MAIFEGTPLEPVVLEPDVEPEPSADVPAPEAPAIQFNWAYVLVPLGVIAAAGAGVGAALFIKKRRENGYETEEESQ